MSDLRGKLRLGWWVFAALMVLEVVEYGAGQVMKTGNVLPLAILAVAAVYPIVRWYMHIRDLSD